MIDKKQVSPELQKLTQQYLKAEQALLTAQSVLNMARDYMLVCLTKRKLEKKD